MAVWIEKTELEGIAGAEEDGVGLDGGPVVQDEAGWRLKADHAADLEK